MMETYEKVHSVGGWFETSRGLIAVHGREAVQFLNGMVTNDVAKLEEGGQFPAAFPNAQGRLIAVVRVMREGERFLFETEAATHEKVFQNLFKFTYAGDFFVEDLSGGYRYFEIFGRHAVSASESQERFAGALMFNAGHGASVFVPEQGAEEFVAYLNEGLCLAQVDNELYDVLRIEAGIPKYGVDMDETTIVPELGIKDLISYNKGCYIGQEIIARIHFRGHIAKQLIGLSAEAGERLGGDSGGGSLDLSLTSDEGKSAGRLTSAVWSPTLGRTISLGYVRYDHLAEGTELNCEWGKMTVTPLPFVDFD